MNLIPIQPPIICRPIYEAPRIKTLMSFLHVCSSSKRKTLFKPDPAKNGIKMCSQAIPLYRPYMLHYSSSRLHVVAGPLAIVAVVKLQQTTRSCSPGGRQKTNHSQDVALISKHWKKDIYFLTSDMIIIEIYNEINMFSSGSVHQKHPTFKI